VEFLRARAWLDAAVSNGATPAVAIEVGRTDGSIWSQAFGHLTFDRHAAPAATDTIFDLASLTKVIATASLTMAHIEAGRLTLDATVASLLPGWDRPDHRRITVRHLLDHSSGLPAHVRLWERVHGRAGYEHALRHLGLERPPGTASVYSDVGFMLLGFVLETVGGAHLDRQFHALAASWPADIRYRPPHALRARIAPTEFDGWRKRLLVGDVHDENAGALDGVAGHAGLFGSAEAVGAFARLVLKTFRERTALGTPQLMRQFATNTGVPGSSRALAWDTMRPTSSCGTRMSASAIGHTGFTGTSLWIDWERDRYVVLLSNRVHPTRSNDAFVALRPQIHDAVFSDE
jgi:CubicO group peptidase (beta-lactamase class C family)